MGVRSVKLIALWGKCRKNMAGAININGRSAVFNGCSLNVQRQRLINGTVDKSADSVVMFWTYFVNFR